MDLDDFLNFLEEADQMHRQTGVYLNQTFHNLNYHFGNTFRWFIIQMTNQFLFAPIQFGNVPHELRREILALLNQLREDRITVEQFLHRLDLMDDNGNGQIEEIFDDEEDQMGPDLPNETADNGASSRPGDIIATEPIDSGTSDEPLTSNLSEQPQNYHSEPSVNKSNGKSNPNESNVVVSSQSCSTLQYKCNWPSCERSFRHNYTLVEHRQRHCNASVNRKQKRASASLSKVAKQKGHLKPFYCKWHHCEMSSKRKHVVFRHIQTLHYKFPRKLTPKMRATLNKEELLNYVGQHGNDGNTVEGLAFV